MTDTLLGLIPHPLPIAAHVLSEPLGPLPLLREELFVFTNIGMHRWQAGKLRRNLDHRLVDENGDGIEVAGVCLQAEPLSL